LGDVIVDRNGILYSEKGGCKASREVVILLADMAHYAMKTSGMGPEQLCDFIIDYHEKLQDLIFPEDTSTREYAPYAGDSAIAVFDQEGSEEKSSKCVRALQAALRVVHAISAEKLDSVRIGLFVGDIIEARFNNHILKFGISFTAANRLEELCGYFGTNVLMDREVALAQNDEKQFIISIGKITPKNFKHPLNVYSIYKPGIHNCPHDIDEIKLIQFISMKNEAMDYFSGNEKKNIKIDYPLAKSKLHNVAKLFKEITGKDDPATLRILEYIGENPFPTDDFIATGMMIESKGGDSLGVRLLHLSRELFKALDRKFYNTLVINTEWEKHFTLEWKEKGETIITIGDQPDGIYYISKGEVEILDEKQNVITVLGKGNVFGEMAYFCEQKRRNATVIASTDIVLNKISCEDFDKFPNLKKIFEEIAKKRRLQPRMDIG
jgi:class 3 adenylate cyclase